MIRVNDNFCKLPDAYLFTEVARRIKSFQDANPGVEIIRMGIGDVTRPVCPAAIKALEEGAADQGRAATFHGYGPEQGYAFLRDAISRVDYHDRGIAIEPDEIFVSDGAKSDTGNIGDILPADARIAVTDPVYPVYIDSNVMAGRAGELGADGRWSRIVYLPCTAANGFVPALPTEKVDAVYLCYPNNPTGTTLTREQLKVWVDWARREGVLLLFDSAYEAYIRDETAVPRSIYEIESAKEVAIEFRSFSKTAGFTGVRCGYTVVPRALKGCTAQGREVSVREMWNRRQCTKFNGASYPVQRAAAALYTDEGRAQVRESIDYYMANAAILRRGLMEAGYEVYGGQNSPYIWLKTPRGMTSWEFFDHLLHNYHIAGTPGSGFGPSGEGYFRLTAFNTREATEAAIARLTAK